MQSLHVSRVFAVDADTAFDVIADHAGYASLPGVARAWVRTQGTRESNGVGAERVLQLTGGPRIVERITEYAPGEALGYRIIESPLPITHEGARITFEPVDRTHTRVHWQSRLRAGPPLIGAPFEFAIARQMALAYAMALRIWAHRLR